jgi:hypothetical protein
MKDGIPREKMMHVVPNPKGPAIGDARETLTEHIGPLEKQQGQLEADIHIRIQEVNRLAHRMTEIQNSSLLSKAFSGSSKRQFLHELKLRREELVREVGELERQLEIVINTIEEHKAKFVKKLDS